MQINLADNIPHDDTMVNDALQAFYAQHNLGEDGGLHKKWATLKVGRFHIPFPNTKARKRAILWHDIHHMATGYSGYWQGEVSIGAWEVSSGCADYYAAWFLDLGAVAVGLFLFPGLVYKGFIRGRRTLNLYSNMLSAEQAKSMTLGEVRKLLKLNIEDSTPVSFSELSAFVGWSLFALLLFGWPFLLLLLCLAGVI